MFLATVIIPSEMYGSSISAFVFERTHAPLIAMDCVLPVFDLEKCGARGRGNGGRRKEEEEEGVEESEHTHSTPPHSPYIGSCEITALPPPCAATVCATYERAGKCGANCLTSTCPEIVRSQFAA